MTNFLSSNIYIMSAGMNNFLYLGVSLVFQSFSYKISAKSGRPFLKDVPVASVGKTYFHSR